MLIDTPDLKKAQTLPSILSEHSALQPERTIFTFLKDGKQEEITLSFRELESSAKRIAAFLRERCGNGDRVILAFPSGPQYVEAMFACFYANVVAVPVYPPTNPKVVDRFIAVSRDCMPALVLTTREIKMKLLTESTAEGLGSLRSIPLQEWITEDELQDAGELSGVILPHLDDMAFLQYTSGSTGTPKGVMVTHGNLHENHKTICDICHYDKHTVGFSWLPFYHDLGLIGNILQAAFVGYHLVLMDPYYFIRDPLNWLLGISRYRASSSGGPNFAYELCARRLERVNSNDLDLSCWKLAFCGAEPLRAETLNKFVVQAGRFGFDARALNPGYGLAEATLVVSGSELGRGARFLSVKKNSISEGTTVEAGVGQDTAILVSSGNLTPNQTVLILHPDNKSSCGNGRIGEICVHGANVAKGYWGRATEDESFQTVECDDKVVRILRTGDLGFILDGDLYVTGRKKDLIIINGKNHYPQDIEDTVAKVDAALRYGAGAAFPVEINQEEKLIVVQEIAAKNDEVGILAGAILDAILAEHGIQSFEVVLIKRGTIAKTTSGKIQRRECKRQYLSNDLDVIYRSRGPDNEKQSGGQPESLTPEEKEIQKRVADFLSVSPAKLRAETTLGQLGMDSVGIIGFKQFLEAVYGLDIELGSLLGGFRISDLYRLVTRSEKRLPALNLEQQATVDMTARRLPFPITEEQQSLLYLDSLYYEDALYNISRVFQVESPIPVKAIESALNTIAAAHPILTAKLVETEHGEIQQEFQEDFRVPLTLIPGKFSHAELDAELSKWSHLPFQPKSKTLFRVVYFPEQNPAVILFVFHHLICDYHSLLMFYQDWMALLQGRELANVEEGNYQEFVRAKIAYKDSERYKSEVSYWLNTIGRRNISRLPVFIHRGRARKRSFSGRHRFIEFDNDLRTQIRNVSMQLGCSVYALMVAAFQAYLSAICGESIIPVGTTVTHRIPRRYRNLFGYAVNPVAIVNDMNESRTIAEWIKQTSEYVLGALQHGSVSLAELINAKQDLRDEETGEIFDIVLNYFRLPDGEHEAFSAWVMDNPAKDPGIKWNDSHIKLLKREKYFSQFPIEVHIVESDKNLCAALLYREDAVDEAFIDSLVREWPRHLGWFCNNLDVPPASYPGISRPSGAPALEKRLLDRALSGYPPIHKLFEQACDSHPDQIAIRTSGRNYRYYELERDSNRIAHYLAKKQFENGSPIMLLMAPDYTMVCVMLGVLKAGLCLLSLSEDYPGERIENIATDSRALFCFTDRNIPEDHCIYVRLQPKGLGILNVDSEEGRAALLAQPTLRADCKVTGVDMAYYVYTSGTTGRPKGIVMNHQNFVSFITWQAADFGIKPGVSMLQQGAMGFDLSFCEILGAICFGGTACMGSKEQRSDPVKLVEWLAESEAHILQIIPSYFRYILEAMRTAPESQRSRLRNNLRSIWFLGERLPVELVKDSFRELPNTQLHNLFGPSEVVSATCYAIDRSFDGDAVPVGTPIAERKVIVVNDLLGRCKEGEVGEILVGGDFLCLGYLNLAAEVREKFIEIPGEVGTYYRMGDLGRWNKAGVLEFVGRKDNQIKLHGIRVELEEIDKHLNSHESVKEGCAFVSTKPGEYLVERLCAALVVEPSFKLDEFQKHLKRKMPEHVVPSQYFSIPQLLRNHNGKIDRAGTGKSPELRNLLERQSDFVSTDELETRLLDLWSKVLNLSCVDPAKSFFENGGNSLLAMQCRNMVNHRFRISMPLNAFIRAGSAAELTAHIRRHLEESEKDEREREKQLFEYVVQLTETEVLEEVRRREGL